MIELVERAFLRSYDQSVRRAECVNEQLRSRPGMSAEGTSSFAYRKLRNIGQRGQSVCVSGHSALTPSSLMIGHIFSTSAFSSVASDSGVCRSRGKASYPSSASRDRVAGSANASTAAALSLLIISFGVPLGAKSPYQFV